MESPTKHLGLNLAPEVDEALNVAASTTLSSRARYARIALINALRGDGYLRTNTPGSSNEVRR